MFRKFKIEDSMVRNIFNGSSMDIFQADETSEAVNEHVQKGQDQGLFDQKYVSRSNMDFCMANVLLREVNKQRKLMFKDSLAKNVFSSSNRNLCMAELT